MIERAKYCAPLLLVACSFDPSVVLSNSDADPLPSDAAGPDATPVSLGPDVRLTNDMANSRVPSLVWTGTEFGLAWRDDRNGGSGDEIYFTRIDSTGNKIGEDLRVTNSNGSADVPSLAWSGTEYAIAWQDDRDGNDEIYFARLNGSGVKQGNDLRVTNNFGKSQAPSLVWTGTEFALAWEDDRNLGDEDIYFARIDASGGKQGNDVLVTTDLLSVKSRDASLVWTGSSFAVAWRDERDLNQEIYCAILDTSGAKVGAEVRVSSDPADSQEPSLVWTGEELGVAWTDTREASDEVYLARLDSSCGIQNSEFRVSDPANTSSEPSMLWMGTQFHITWSDRRGQRRDLYFDRITSAGEGAGNALQTTDSPVGDARDPSAATTGTLIGVAWQDDRDGNDEIYFKLITP